MALFDRRMVAPAYLLLCLIVGGSAQGAWGVMALQLVAIAILAWVALDRKEVAAVTRSTRQLLWLIAAVALLVALQLIPLPPGLWSALPGRGPIAEDLAILGVAGGWMPLSLAPYATLSTATALLPPLALLAAILRFGFRPAWIALAVIGVTVAGTLLGVLQISGPATAASPWYLYPISNFGVATGFFANSNHMATLLLVAIPFVGALWVSARDWQEDFRKRIAAQAIAIGSMVVVLVGLALNGSLAGYGLAVPVIVVTMLLIVRPKTGWVQAGILGLGLVGLVGFGVLMASPLADRLMASGAGASLTTRQTVAAQSTELLGNYSVAGSGLGTFSAVYRMTEDPSAVDRTFVNHAHNDYLQIAVEAGLPGVLLMLAFLVWWGSALRQTLRSSLFDQFAHAGVIASGAILVHSLVDFPLRTAAISTLFAASLGLMLASRRKVGSRTDLRPARHLIIR